MRVFRKFQSSDGRIKAITASGVLALAAVVALAVGVLPAMAASVDPVVVDWGGGSGACDDDLVSLEEDTLGDKRGPSAAEHELHIQNPKDGVYFGTDGTKITISGVTDSSDESFTFTIEEGSGMAAYDVVVNGGKKSNHYDYDLEGKTTSSDSGLMAPEKENKPGEVHKLSHINLCYDLQPTFFDCGATAVRAVELGDGLVFTKVEARIFANHENTSCEDKLGFFFADESDAEDPNVLLDFGDDAGTVVAGRLDITKDFGSLPFADLQYVHDALTDALIGPVDVSWCNIRDAQLADLIDNNGAESPFHDVLGSGVYPTLDAVDTDGDGKDDVAAVTDAAGVPALACKVHVEETATGIQYNVVYFEFVDPTFF